MDNIEKLEPVAVWKIFSDICKIPHPSGHEAALAEYVMTVGKACGCKVKQDLTGNVLLEKEASPGMENRKTVIMQAHLDMVPQKNEGVKFNFLRDPIAALIRDGKVTATPTTLGADNGTGVAAALAALKTNTAHGPLRGLFTVEEETGLVGATKLAPEFSQGDILINLDGNSNCFYIGCAGGVRSNYRFPIEWDIVPNGFTGIRIALSGLKGGHSGAHIAEGRGNSHKEMVNFIRRALVRFDLRLNSINGGTVDNAIPRETFAVAAIPEKEVSPFSKFTSDYVVTAQTRLGTRAPEFAVGITREQLPDKVFASEFQTGLLNVLNECPDGVIAMSRIIPGLVETSTNLAIISTEESTVRVKTSQRSLDDAAKDELAAAMAGLFEAAGAETSTDNPYPGWKPNPDSEILKVANKVYRSKFGEQPVNKAIHAGLECGVIGALNPGLDLISFGAEVTNPHSPDEAVEIASVGKSWELLLGILENIPEKQPRSLNVV